MGVSLGEADGLGATKRVRTGIRWCDGLEDKSKLEGFAIRFDRWRKLQLGDGEEKFEEGQWPCGREVQVVSRRKPWVEVDPWQSLFRTRASGWASSDPEVSNGS